MNRILGGIGNEGIYRNSFLTSSRILSFSSVILFVLSSASVVALPGRNGGARSICLGGSFAAVAGDVWSLHQNPAGLGLIENLQAAIFFTQQFGLDELRTMSFAAALPLDFATVGVGIERFGFDFYRETGLSIALGGPIGLDAFGGIRFHYDRIEIQRYGSTGILLVDAGVGARPFEELMIGCFVCNIVGARIGARNQRLPQSVTLGAGYSLFEDFLLTFEMEKDVRYPAIIKAGIEQRLFELVAARCGVSTNPDDFSIGIGLRYSLCEFGYAGSNHPDLGWTHSIDLTFRL